MAAYDPLLLPDDWTGDCACCDATDLTADDAVRVTAEGGAGVCRDCILGTNWYPNIARQLDPDWEAPFR